eukprot:CAMPEP_0176205486 /NCGR_PEP_ID=MMETSP0121_2-20121125/11619_1 /TAXON_ID=160619 /ORGANISM="Kryptoperidinium foliaceum, Strain CCMP 1326" /LENGTH=117 /DNA_ID=CAMNT_0017544421 /DNA_START=438 /DNA_END=787 /DNA_ORIENTATION=-
MTHMPLSDGSSHRGSSTYNACNAPEADSSSWRRPSTLATVMCLANTAATFSARMRLCRRRGSCRLRRRRKSAIRNDARRAAPQRSARLAGDEKLEHLVACHRHEAPEHALIREASMS